MSLLHLIDDHTKALIDAKEFQKCVNQNRDAILFLINQSALLMHMYGSTEQGISWMKLGLNIGPEQAMMWSHLAVMLTSVNLIDEAKVCNDRALKCKDQRAEAYHNQGIILGQLHQFAEAEEMYKLSLQIADTSLTRFNMGATQFFQGRYREGLANMECRLHKDVPDNRIPHLYDKPLWDGVQDLKDKKVLLINEQGMGDAVQFVRYLPDLQAACGKVYMEVQDPLVSLFRHFGVGVFGRDLIYKEKRQLPDHDFLVCFSSLPHFFDPDCVARHEPYLAPWKPVKKTPGGFFSNHLNVGICWAGNHQFPTDYLRSCPLRHYDVLAREGVKFYSLQHGEMKRRYADMVEGSRLEYIDCIPYCTDINDLAVVMQRLDLVITTDTVVAHVAGAMGVRTWLLLGHSCDWRWLHTGESTWWYPSVRLFRQRERNGWDELLGVVAAELSRLV